MLWCLGRLLVQQGLDARGELRERLLQVGDVYVQNVAVQVSARLELLERIEAAHQCRRPVRRRGDKISTSVFSAWLATGRSTAGSAARGARTKALGLRCCDVGSRALENAVTAGAVARSRHSCSVLVHADGRVACSVIAQAEFLAGPRLGDTSAGGQAGGRAWAGSVKSSAREIATAPLWRFHPCGPPLYPGAS